MLLKPLFSLKACDEYDQPVHDVWASLLQRFSPL